ncbi:MAG: hypothetical protein K2F94_07660 [Muribaculaceae bacterium]|nr:hypothetical protein [Muribaculaceae bacterium]MDE6533920.1 hypothetical protein [Muribaculaceae bacterium]
MTPLELLEKRHSVRSYSDKPVATAVLNKIKAAVTMVNTHEQGLKFQVITDDPEPFHGFDKAYGMFSNPRNYIAAVVDTATPDVYERAGYFAEQIAIKAVEAGLATCFVGGTYKSGAVKAQLRAGEKILFLLLFGYTSEKKRPMAKLMEKFIHRKKMAPEDFFSPESEISKGEEIFPDLMTGLEGMICAPSALNRRPARVFVKTVDGIERICAKVDKPDNSTLIDLGIAKFNFNYATSTFCEWGNGAPIV